MSFAGYRWQIRTKNRCSRKKVISRVNSLVLDGIAGPQTLKHLGIEVLHGIDVSAWNGKNIDWKAVSKTNVEYCWIKATEGVTHTNRGHADKFKGARDNGLIVGGYHFARPDYNNNDKSAYGRSAGSPPFF